MRSLPVTPVPPKTAILMVPPRRLTSANEPRAGGDRIEQNRRARRLHLLVGRARYQTPLIGVDAPVAGFTTIIETLATANQITSSPWPIIVT